MRGYATSKLDYQHRLRRVEGQVRGVQRMIEEDAYCIDVLTQISAASKALERVAVGLLADHLRHCVSQAQGREGPAERDELIAEAMQALDRLLK